MGRSCLKFLSNGSQRYPHCSHTPSLQNQNQPPSFVFGQRFNKLCTTLLWVSRVPLCMCYLYVSSCRLYCREWLNTNELAAYPAHGGVVNPPMHTLVCRFVAPLNLASTWESGLGALSAYDHNLELPTQVIQGAGYRMLLGPDGGQNAKCVRTEAGSVGGSVIGMLDGNQFQKQPEDKIKFRVYY